MRLADTIIIACAAAALTVSCERKAEPVATERMDRARLNIGTYFLQPYARTEQHVKELSECGIDFVIGMPDEMPVLDLFQKYGVGAIVNGVFPGWWGGDGDNAGTMAQINPLQEYDNGAKSFVDHPAIWGIDIGDEPSALDFPHYGRVFEKVNGMFPGVFPYLNLYPNYASVASNDGEQTVNQLGTKTYADHISEYCRNVPSDYICYDFYLYSIDVPRAYENLCTVSDACTASGRSMWIVLQVNSNRPEEWITENELRFQAFTAMAFGAEVITWACYTAGWWYNQVLDDKGEKTVQYERLKAVNREIHAIGEPYMKYRRTSTAFVGFGGTPWLDGVSRSAVGSCTSGHVSGLKAEDDSPLAVGYFEARDGGDSEALFIVSADDPYDKGANEHTISFKLKDASSNQIRLTSTTGERVPMDVSDGTCTFRIESNTAVLMEVLQ